MIELPEMPKKGGTSKAISLPSLPEMPKKKEDTVLSGKTSSTVGKSNLSDKDLSDAILDGFDSLIRSDAFLPAMPSKGAITGGIMKMASAASSIAGGVADFFESGARNMASYMGASMAPMQNLSLKEANERVSQANKSKDKSAVTKSLYEFGQAFNQVGDAMVRNSERSVGIKESNIDKGVVDTLLEGDVGDAFKKIGVQTLAQVPNLIALGATGGGAGAFVAGSALGTGSALTEEYGNDEDISLKDSIKSIGKGLVEGASEYIFSADIQAAKQLGKAVINLAQDGAKKPIAELIRTAGKDGAKELVTRSLGDVLKKGLKGAGEEGVEEVASELGGFIIDRVDDGKWNQKEFEGLAKRAGDAFLLGATTGGLMSGGLALASMQKLTKSQLNQIERYKEIVNDDSVSDDTKKIAQSKIDNIIKYNADQSESNYKAVASLPKEQRTEALKLLSEIDKLQEDKENITQGADVAQDIDAKIDANEKALNDLINTNEKALEQESKATRLATSQEHNQALSELFARQDELGQSIESQDASLDSLRERINNGEEIPAQELSSARDTIYNIIQKVDDSDLNNDQKNTARNMFLEQVDAIENLLPENLSSEGKPFKERAIPLGLSSLKGEPISITTPEGQTIAAKLDVSDNGEVEAKPKRQFTKTKQVEKVAPIKVNYDALEVQETNTDDKGEVVSAKLVDSKTGNVIETNNPEVLDALPKKKLQSPVKRIKSKVAPKAKPTITSSSMEVTDNSNVSEFMPENVSQEEGTKVAKFTKALKSIAPNVKVIVHKSGESMRDALLASGVSQENANKAVNAYGVNDSKNKVIHINASKGKAHRSLAHEIFHSVLNNANNKEAFNTMKEQVIKLLDKEDAEALSKFASKYKDAKNAEEFLSELSALVADGDIALRNTTISKVATSIKNFVKDVATKINSEELSNWADGLFKGATNRQELVNFFNEFSRSLNEGTDINLAYISDKKQASKPTSNKQTIKAVKERDDVNNVPVLKGAETNYETIYLPRQVFEMAYKNDDANNAITSDGKPKQTLDNIIRRGGYSISELNSLLPNWKEITNEIRDNAKAQKQNEPTKTEGGEVSTPTEEISVSEEAVQSAIKKQRGRPKVNKEKTKGLKETALGIEEANYDPYDLALLYFIRGGKLLSSDAQAEKYGTTPRKSLKSLLRGNAEHKSRIGLLSKNGSSLDVIAETLQEENSFLGRDYDEFVDAVEQAILNHNSWASMARELVERYIDKPQRDFLEALENAAIANDMAGENNSQEDIDLVQDILDNIDEYPELARSLDPTPEEIEEAMKSFEDDYLNFKLEDVPDYYESSFKREAELENSKTTLLEKYRLFRKYFGGDRAINLRKALEESKLNEVIYLMYNKAGASNFGDLEFAKVYDKIFKGMDEKTKKVFDTVVAMKRVIAIEENFERRREKDPKLKSPEHTSIKVNGKDVKMTKQVAIDQLAEIKKIAGDDAYRMLEEKADAYFKAFSDILKTKYENGLITLETFKLYRDYKYSPRKYLNFMFGSSFQDLEIKPDDFKRGGVNISAKEIGKIKEGSESEMMMDTAKMLKMAMISTQMRIFTNNAARELYNQGKKAGVDFVKDVDYLVKKNEPNKGQVKRDKEGNPLYDTTTERGWRIVKYKEDGITKAYKLKEQFAKELFDEQKVQEGKGSKIARFIAGTKLTQFTATGINLAFAVSNTFMDNFNHVFFTDNYGNGFAPYAMGKALTKTALNTFKILTNKYSKFKNKELNDLMYEYAQYGGLMSTLTEDSQANFLNKTGEYLGALGNASEIASKISAYQTVRDRLIKEYTKKKGVAPSGDDLKSIKTEAAYRARQAMDFSRGGIYIKYLNGFSAFLNVAIQSNEIALKYIKDNPVKFLKKINELGLLVSGITLYNLLTAKADYDDEKNQDDILKNIVIFNPFEKEGEKGRLSIPTPSQVKAFLNPYQVLGEAVYEMITGNKVKRDRDYDNKATKLLDDTLKLFQTNVLSKIPTTLKMVLEYKMNRNFWRDSEIVRGADGIADKDEGLYNERVNQMYKLIGGAFNMSPARMQQAVGNAIAQGNPIVQTFYATVDNIINSVSNIPEAEKSKYAKDGWVSVLTPLPKTMAVRLYKEASKESGSLSDKQAKMVQEIKEQEGSAKQKVHAEVKNLYEKKAPISEVYKYINNLEGSQRKGAFREYKTLQAKDRIENKGNLSEYMAVKFAPNNTTKAKIILELFPDVEENKSVIKDLSRIDAISKDVLMEVKRLKREQNDKED